MFNPMSKICSIHFKPNDFTSDMERKNGRLYKQSVLKNNYIVPTLYLKPYEYTKFTRKRKKRTTDDARSMSNLLLINLNYSILIIAFIKQSYPRN